MKIDNLVEINKTMKEVIKKKTDENENMKMDLDSLKEEISINIKKINNLEMQNKKINKEYENLNKDFFIIKNEKEKLNADLEEQKAEIFNYQKELSKNMKKKNNNKSNFQNDNNNYEDFNWNNISEKKTESIKYHFGQFEKKENNNINEYYDEKKD